MKKQKLLVTVFAGLLFLAGAGIAVAQSRGGGGHGGGGMSSGGGWSGGHGGSNWSGGHGGSSWNGSGWHGSGGNWNGGWRGSGWHGTNVGVWFGFPGTWWWPAYYPYGGYPYYGYAGYPYYGDAYYGGGYYSGGAGYADQGQVTYIQRDTVPAAPSAPAMRNSGPGEYSYYCIDPPGYYPQVQQCTKAWLKVVPDVSPRPTPIPQYSQ